jgi:hypothetical protein
MNWEIFWTGIAVLAVYEGIKWALNAFNYWQLKKDYGSIENILDRINNED